MTSLSLLVIEHSTANDTVLNMPAAAAVVMVCVSAVPASKLLILALTVSPVILGPVRIYLVVLWLLLLFKGVSHVLFCGRRLLQPSAQKCHCPAVMHRWK